MFPVLSLSQIYSLISINQISHVLCVLAHTQKHKHSIYVYVCTDVYVDLFFTRADRNKL